MSAFHNFEKKLKASNDSLDKVYDALVSQIDKLPENMDDPIFDEWKSSVLDGLEYSKSLDGKSFYIAFKDRNGHHFFRTYPDKGWLLFNNLSMKLGWYYLDQLNNPLIFDYQDLAQRLYSIEKGVESKIDKETKRAAYENILGKEKWQWKPDDIIKVIISPDPIKQDMMQYYLKTQDSKISYRIIELSTVLKFTSSFPGPLADKFDAKIKDYYQKRPQ